MPDEETFQFRRTFAGAVALEGIKTQDGRMIALNALTWSEEHEYPIWYRQSGAQTGTVVGVVTTFQRTMLDEGTAIIEAYGWISDAQPLPAVASLQVEQGTVEYVPVTTQEPGHDLPTTDLSMEIVRAQMGSFMLLTNLAATSAWNDPRIRIEWSNQE